jgi:hypothetical protein
VENCTISGVVIYYDSATDSSGISLNDTYTLSSVGTLKKMVDPFSL